MALDSLCFSVSHEFLIKGVFYFTPGLKQLGPKEEKKKKKKLTKQLLVPQIQQVVS